MTFEGPTASMQRAVGRLHIGVKHKTRTTLETLYQQGCLKARFPHTHRSDMEAVLINTSGGVTDGDQLDIALDAQTGSDLTVTTPAAERIYRALPNTPPARISVTAHIADRARLDYLPQETILFDNCALNRTLYVDMHENARFLGVEALLFGRTLHGEALTTLRLRDTIRIRRAGRLILHDGVRLQGGMHAKLTAPASAGLARATATIVLVAPDAETHLPHVRDALKDAEAGASVWDGMLLARLVATDGQALRRLVAGVLACLRENPLPRLWAS
jgi:urease accessory protein